MADQTVSAFPFSVPYPLRPNSVAGSTLSADTARSFDEFVARVITIVGVSFGAVGFLCVPVVYLASIASAIVFGLGNWLKVFRVNAWRPLAQVVDVQTFRDVSCPCLVCETVSAYNDPAACIEGTVAVLGCDSPFPYPAVRIAPQRAVLIYLFQKSICWGWLSVVSVTMPLKSPVVHHAKTTSVPFI